MIGVFYICGGIGCIWFLYVQVWQESDHKYFSEKEKFRKHMHRLGSEDLFEEVLYNFDSHKELYHANKILNKCLKKPLSKRVTEQNALLKKHV